MTATLRQLIVKAVLCLGIGAVALLVRAPGTDRAFTIDERLWIDRSDRFVDAVTDGRFSDTVESGHPGVTTMWVAGLAQRTLPDTADLRARYTRARLWIAVVSSGLVVLIYGLARIVLGEVAALVGGLLVALDPFVLALNRLVHVDGLLALLMAASLLALLASVRAKDRRLLVLSGVLAGLSLLTKQPAAFLIPVAVIVLWRDGERVMRRLLMWAVPAAVTAIAAWPVLWVRPWHAIDVMAGGGGTALTEGHSGGFFLGHVGGDPGPLFYPVAFAFRSSAFILPAAVVTAIWAVRKRREEPARTAAILLALALGFLLMMTIAPKKGDRYILPSFVLVDLAVAVAMAELIRARGRLVVGLTAGLLAFHCLPALSLHPYELSHFNWVTGGSAVAERTMVVGFGQGLDQAARALNRLPSAASLTVASTTEFNFTDFFAGRTVGIERSTLVPTGTERPDLVLFYISSIQVGQVDQVWDRFRDREPIYELDINGIPYVRVYRAIPS